MLAGDGSEGIQEVVARSDYPDLRESVLDSWDCFRGQAPCHHSVPAVVAASSSVVGYDASAAPGEEHAVVAETGDCLPLDSPC